VSSFREAIETSFPGAMPSANYLKGVRSAIEPMGFNAETTLSLVSICRDELTTPFFDQIEADWGNAFQLAGLGGVPALGWTGWTAALSHVPNYGGRGGVLVFGFPHIGIEEDGTIGVTIRPGQSTPTSTCGALASISAQAKAGTLPTEVDVDDFEATKLALRLVDPIHHPTPDILELTIAALDALEVDLWRALDRFEVWRDHDVTVWCGVQIHAHGADWVWPRDAWYSGADGHRRRVVMEPDEF